MTKRCAKHAALPWLPAEKLITTPCVVSRHSTLGELRPFRVEIGRGGLTSGCQKNKAFLASQVKKHPSWLTGRTGSCQSGAHRTIIVSIAKTSCQ